MLNKDVRHAFFEDKIENIIHLIEKLSEHRHRYAALGDKAPLEKLEELDIAIIEARIRLMDAHIELSNDEQKAAKKKP